MQVTPEVMELIAARAVQMMDAGVEPTSAIKQAASDQGVPYGDEMSVVVHSLLSSLCGGIAQSDSNLKEKNGQGK